MKRSVVYAMPNRMLNSFVISGATQPTSQAKYFIRNAQMVKEAVKSLGLHTIIRSGGVGWGVDDDEF